MKWFYELLSLSLSVTPIITLLLLLKPFIKKRYSARWRYILWIAISIRMLLPYSLINYMPVLFKAPITNVLPSVSIGEHIKIDAVNLQSISNNPVEILYAIYLAGVIFYLIREIFSYIGFRRDVIRWSRKILNYEVKTIFTDEKRRLNIKRDIPVIISKKVSSPMLLGLIKPTLVLPSEAYTTAELKMILTHELVHFKRNDILIKTLLMITFAVHWFNPAVYFMIKQANKDMEQSCDDYVLNGYDIDAKKFYCNTILRMAILNNNAEGPVFSTNIVSNRRNLESRIKDIFDNSKKKKGIVVLVTLIMLVIISGMIFNASGAEQIELEQSEKYLEGYTEANDWRNNELETDNKLSQSVNIQESLEESEVNGVKDNITEIVIVDLNQLENQLLESKFVDKEEE